MKKMMLLTMVLLVLTTGIYAQDVNGDVSTINGVEVVRLWGTHYERGYAQGYLMPEKVEETFTGFALDNFFAYYDIDYPTARQFYLDNYVLEQKYIDEAMGTIDGMAAADYSLYNESLGRDLDHLDWLVMAGITEYAFMPTLAGVPSYENIHCSTLSSWGSATMDDPELRGAMVVTRNFDWFTENYSNEQYNITIHYPSEEGELNWIQPNFSPGALNVYGAINELGFAVFNNDGNMYSNSNITNLYPSQLAWRNCIEMEDGNGDGSNDLSDFVWQRDQHTYLYPSIVTCVSPDSAIILETNNSGVTQRSVVDNVVINGNNLAATNHFRELYAPTACSRFSNIKDSLNANSNITIERSWDMMGAAAGVSFNQQKIEYIPAHNILKYAYVGADGTPAYQMEPAVFITDFLFSQTPVATVVSVNTNRMLLTATVQLSNPLDNQVEVWGLIRNLEGSVVDSVEMIDDGLHMDEEANDLLFGLSEIRSLPAGNYNFETVVTNLDSGYVHHSSRYSISISPNITIHVPVDSSTIQAGLNGAFSGDTVLVIAGTYVENIVWPATNGIKLIGAGRDLSIIDGDSSGSVIRFEEDLGGIIDSTTIISGFALQNGYAFFGGGIFCVNSHPSLSDVSIHNNSGIGTGMYGSGGGIYCEASNMILNNMSITDNRTNGWGGGINCYSSNLSLANVTISRNESLLQGGGIYCSSSDLSLAYVIISDNHSLQRGAGIACSESNPVLTNVTIVNNAAFSSGGEGEGGGIYCEQNSNLTTTNTIVWGNSPEQVFFRGDWGGPNSIQIAFSNIESGLEGILTNENGTVGWHGGNMDVDPLFCDPEEQNYHLSENSLCVGGGEVGDDMGALGIGCTLPVEIAGDEASLPSEYVLHQNYPNPFNPSTTIAYDLPENADVSVKVYDIIGQEIISLVSEQQSSGYKSVQWNGTNNLGHQVSTGMYLYVIHAGEFTQTRKMLLLK
ncbi:MAG: T9SS type A sorting domain-containing protein [Candidatus Marinimicrobia bacterium]|jgi:predicted outer membrane repeat protein|nr:T9SS type A sorting domain-containing protein [Candidatus Neomarinimicrobiota bacterium]MBT3576400.1 T9SS type A sorting domain-containing protein [Candidatus Neomarinimicrobiota bacterium]MBT3680098.1 T9SS type A sorting domain-containing protein [Candidatus Neomarinimicrobiota bacterium]MBT3950083.1 T9SS type A sorting domain-containing protein [Candidatus Neomarinimicrobiota bacterium]MBT4254382.1 T9SS type A sorting domain-containing protein [Candidatus Neomarinimicrobiota bacterium]